MPKTFQHYVAGIDREFCLDMKTAQRVEDVIGSLMGLAMRMQSGDVKFKELAAILYFTRVNPDKVTFDAFAEGIFKEGYINYMPLMRQLIEDFFQQGAPAAPSATPAETKEAVNPS